VSTVEAQGRNFAGNRRNVETSCCTNDSERPHRCCCLTVTCAGYSLYSRLYHISNKCIAVRHTATGTHMTRGITQCYLPSGRGDILALTPAEAGTRLSDPGGVDLVGLLHTEMAYPPEDGHPSRY